MEVARLIAVIDAQTGKFTSALKGANDDLDKLKRKMNGVDDGLDRTGNRMGAFGGKVGSGMKMAGAAVAGFGVAAGVAAGVGIYKSIQAASDLNETVSKTKVIFGKSGNDIVSWSKTTANAYGMSQRAAMDAAGGYAIFAKGAGMGDKEAAKFSKTLVGTAADLASFYNTSTDDAATAIQAALRGETEPIRRYGVMLDDASLRQQAMKMGIIKTTKDALTPQQKVLAANAVIMKQTAVAQGDFARTSDGMANQQRILSATMEDAKAKIGAAFLPFVNMILPKIVAAIPPIVQMVTGFTDKISALGQSFLSNGEQMGKFQAQATSIFATIGAAVASFVNPIKQAFATLASDPQAAMSVMKSFGTIVQQIGAFAQRVAPALGQYLGASITALGKIAGAVMPIVADAFEKILPPLGRLIVAVAKIGAVVMNVLGTVIPPIVRALAPIFSAVFGVIGNVIDMIASLLEGDFTGAFRAAKAAIKAIWITIPGMLLGVLTNAITAVAGAAANLGSRMISGIADAITSGAGRIGSAISTAIRDAITNIDIPGFSPPEHAAAEAIGNPLARGVKMGFLAGTADLPEKIEGRIKAALERGKRVIEKQSGVLQGSFGKLGQNMLRAFDAQTQRKVAGIQATGAELTPAEAALAAEQAAHDERQRLADRAAADAALAKAQAEGDAQGMADAQARIDELNYQDRIAALQKVADAERKARDEDTARKVLDYEAEREAQRGRYEAQIADLEAFLERRNVSQAAKNKKLSALMNDPAMKDALEDSGLNLGKAFSVGIDKSEKNVRAAIKRLAKLVRDYLELNSPAKRGPLSTLDSWWTAMPDTLLSGVDTGMIGQVAAGIAAPDSGAIGGASAGAGATIINVTVQGSVTSERDLVDTIRTELIKTGQRNGTIFGSYA